MRLDRPAAVAAVLLAAACGNGHLAAASDAAAVNHAPADAAALAADEPDAAPMPTVIFTSPEARVTVALARSALEQQRGLMYVQHLPPDAGMLFIFNREALQEFWMKNTLIALDMIFIRADLTVAGVVANATPLTLDPRGVDTPSRYVLEVNGGWAAAHGVVKGQKVRFEGVP